MSPRLLRPIASSVHPEANAWRTAVVANGGSVSASTMRAVSKFCADIDAAGIRNKFYRLNLFCGDGLTAALVPLYRAESRTGTALGNSIDTNNGPFVSGDFNNTGSSSGLKGNGSTKFLDTGLFGNAIPGNDSHLGFGLRATQTGSAAFRRLGGVWNGSSNSINMSVRRNDANLNCEFGAFSPSSFTAGEVVQNNSLSVGDVMMAFPSFYRNGVATGTSATASLTYPSAHAIYIFALLRADNSIVLHHTDARLNWYSIGLTMTSAEALSFYNAIAAFNTALSRT
jgi:hypothetical protein